MVVIQLPALKQRRRFEIEQILSIFDSKAGIYLEIDEKEYPTAFLGFLERLSTVMKNPEVVRDLVYEEILNHEFQENHRKYTEMKEELKNVIISEERANAEKEKAMAREKESHHKIEKQRYEHSRNSLCF